MAYKLEVYEYGIFVVADDGTRTYQDIDISELSRDDKGNYYYIFDDGEEEYYLCGKMSTKVNPLDFTIDENNIFHIYNGNTYTIDKRKCEALANCGITMLNDVYTISVLRVLEKENLQDEQTQYKWSIEISCMLPDSYSVDGKKVVVYTGTLTGITGGE